MACRFPQTPTLRDRPAADAAPTGPSSDPERHTASARPPRSPFSVREGVGREHCEGRNSGAVLSLRTYRPSGR
eukprot:10703234-Alexandrium_andersonii.AAC.1